MTKPGNVVPFRRQESSNDDFKHRMIMNGLALFWIIFVTGAAALVTEIQLVHEEKSQPSYLVSML